MHVPCITHKGMKWFQDVVSECRPSSCVVRRKPLCCHLQADSKCCSSQTFFHQRPENQFIILLLLLHLFPTLYYNVSITDGPWQAASMMVRHSLSRTWKALSCSWAHKPRTIWIPMKIQRRGWSMSLKNGEALHLDQGGVHLVELSISKVSKNPNPDLNISPPCFTSTSKTLYSLAQPQTEVTIRQTSFDKAFSVLSYILTHVLIK